MPELVELGVRGGGHGGVAVAKRDDGDPAAEVEVLLPGVVPDAAAVAADDRHVGAGVGREHGGARLAADALARRGHAGTSVGADRRLDPAARGADGGHQLRDDAALENAVAEPRLRVIGREHARDGAVEKDARDVADEEDPLRAESDRERRGGLVGVHVEGSRGERHDDRNPPRRERLTDRGWRRGLRVADEAEPLDDARLAVRSRRHGGRPRGGRPPRRPRR